MEWTREVRDFVADSILNVFGKRPAVNEGSGSRKHFKRGSRELVKVKDHDTNRVLADDIVLIPPQTSLPAYGRVQNVQILPYEDEREREWEKAGAQVDGFYSALGLSGPGDMRGQDIHDRQLVAALELAEMKYGSPCVIRGFSFAAALDVPLLFFRYGFHVAIPKTVQPPAFQPSDARPVTSNWYPKIRCLTSPENLWSYMTFTPKYVLFDPTTESIGDGVFFLSLMMDGNTDTRNNRVIVYKYDDTFYLLDPKTLCPGVECQWRANLQMIRLHSFFHATPHELVAQIAKEAREEPKFQGRSPPKSILAKRGMFFVKFVQEICSQNGPEKTSVGLYDAWTGAPFKFYRSDFRDGALAALKNDTGEVWTEQDGKKYMSMMPTSSFFKKYLTRNGIRRWLNQRIEQRGPDLEHTIDRMMAIGYYGIYIEPPAKGFEGDKIGTVAYNTQGRATL